MESAIRCSDNDLWICAGPIFSEHICNFDSTLCVCHFRNFILASLSSASLDLATYRFVTAFEPTCKEYINLGSFIFGPVLMCLVIGAIILYYTKVKRQAIYTI